MDEQDFFFFFLNSDEDANCFCPSNESIMTRDLPLSASGRCNWKEKLGRDVLKRNVVLIFKPEVGPGSWAWKRLYFSLYRKRCEAIKLPDRSIHQTDHATAKDHGRQTANQWLNSLVAVSNHHTWYEQTRPD